jgi:hypothetical protein
MAVDSDLLVEEEAAGEWCFLTLLAGGSGQKPVLEDEVKTTV